jgi:hypothetical protein
VGVWVTTFRLIREHALWTADEFLAYVLQVDDNRLLSLVMQKSPVAIVEKALHLAQAANRLNRAMWRAGD